MPLTWKMKARYRLRGSAAWDLMWQAREKQQLNSWQKAGKLGPPHIVKQRMILEHAKAFQTSTLVETGTFLGDMVYAMKDKFKDIYSIELSEEFHTRAKSVFAQFPHIHLVAGDSATALETVLSQVSDRCLFWLDGHYSGGITALGADRCPIRGELETILRHPIKNHVILVDDANCFDGLNGYPSMIEMCAIVTSRFPGYEVKVIENVIQIRPAS